MPTYNDDDDFIPLSIQGYASVWHVTYKMASGYERIMPGAFDISSVFAVWNHDVARPVACTEDRTLTLFQDDYGLGFKLVVPCNRSGLWLANSVGRNILRGASFNHKGYAHPEIRNENGRDVKVYKHLVLEEITICEKGANPEACIWLDKELMDELPAHIAEKRERWIAGHMASKRAPAKPAMKAKVTSRLPTEVKAREMGRVPSIDEVLAKAGPILAAFKKD